MLKDSNCLSLQIAPSQGATSYNRIVTCVIPFNMSLFSSCSTFLQITMVNSCPLPLLLDNSSLKTDFNLTLIGRETNLPKVRGREERERSGVKEAVIMFFQVFYSGDSFSFIWQRPKVINSNNASGGGGNAKISNKLIFIYRSVCRIICHISSVLLSTELWKH